MKMPNVIPTAGCVRAYILAGAVAGACLAEPRAAGSEGVVDLGGRRELFIDGWLIDRMEGRPQLRLHHPEPKEIVIEHDAPWEGNVSTFHNIFKDGDIYRMYYVGSHSVEQTAPGDPKPMAAHADVCCYAESRDGIHWSKPNLGLHEFRGSKANNIVVPNGVVDGVGVHVTAPVVFKDENPDASPEARYKAFFLTPGLPPAMLPFKSRDGIHWSPLTREPVIVHDEFDSQNTAFWDATRGEYRTYWRYWAEPVTAEEKRWRPPGYRGIRTATSRDFITWSERIDVQYIDSPPEHLYTNQVRPYHRAPHVFIGFPARYTDRGWTDSTLALPELEQRKARAQSLDRKGTAITESLLMSSRDGVTFHRWNEAFLRPGIERTHSWAYGNQFIAWHLVETKAAMVGAPDELSLYAVESYWTGNSSALRRYTLRLDGFVSVNAPSAGGEIVTRPIRFAGDTLALNFSTSAAGSVRVEVQDAEGRPLPGLTLEECPPLFGDAIERRVTWRPAGEDAYDLASVAGMPVRLRFEIRDADLYAFQFKNQGGTPGARKTSAPFSP